MKYTNHQRSLLKNSHILVSWPLFNSFFVINALEVDPLYSGQSHLYITLPQIWFVFILFFIQVIIFENFVRNNSDNIYQHCIINVAFMLVAILVKRELFGPLPHTTDIRPAIIAASNLTLQTIVLTLVDHSIYLNNRNLSLKNSLKEKELLSIKLRSKPHFIYNTLNLIAVEIQDNPRLAESLIYDLSDLLRLISKSSVQTVTPITNEIEIIKKYISIQKRRFDKKINMYINDACYDQSLFIPSLLLLPLVENIFKHCTNTPIVDFSIVANIIQENTVSIKILNINNNENNIKPKIIENDGDGIKLIKEVLRVNYPNKHVFTLTKVNNYTLAEIIIIK